MKKLRFPANHVYRYYNRNANVDATCTNMTFMF